jgi:hypothetical protein
MKVCIYEVHQLSRHLRSSTRRDFNNLPRSSIKNYQEHHVQNLFDAIVMLETCGEDEEGLYPQPESPMHKAIKVAGRRMRKVIEKFTRELLEDKEGHYTSSDGVVWDWELGNWLCAFDVKGFRLEDEKGETEA